jgi:hypothetical protein
VRAAAREVHRVPSVASRSDGADLAVDERDKELVCAWRAVKRPRAFGAFDHCPPNLVVQLERIGHDELRGEELVKGLHSPRYESRWPGRRRRETDHERVACVGARQVVRPHAQREQMLREPLRRLCLRDEPEHVPPLFVSCERTRGLHSGLDP